MTFRGKAREGLGEAPLPPNLSDTYRENVLWGKGGNPFSLLAKKKVKKTPIEKSFGCNGQKPFPPSPSTHKSAGNEAFLLGEPHLPPGSPTLTPDERSS